MRLSDFFARLTTDGPDTGNLDLTDTGALRIHLDSSMLPGVNVDTYQCFSGDSWVEGELDYLATEGVPSWLVDHPAAQRAVVSPEWDDFDWNYDNRAILQVLSETAADDLVAAGGVDIPQIITDAEVTGTWSPAAYNFATDSFAAWLTLDTDELVAATDDMDTERLREWAEDVWRSRSGFLSSIPRYFRDEPEWATTWAAIAWVLIDSEYDGFMAVAEAEDEAYSGHTEVTLNHRGAEKIWEAVTATEVPDHLDLHDGETLAAALHEYLPVQEETLI